MSDSFDTPLTGSALIETQEKIAGRIAAEIADPFGPLPHLPAPRDIEHPQADMEAYRSVLAAYAYFRFPSPESRHPVESRLEQTIVDFPGYASAWATLALCRCLVGFTILDAHDTHVARTLKEAQTAVQLDPRNAIAQIALCFTSHAAGDMNTFQSAGETATRLNPNHPMTLRLYGAPYAYSIDWDRGLAMVRKAIEISAYVPGWFHIPLALRAYLDGDYQEALNLSDRCRLEPYVIPWLFRTMAYGQMGDMKNAAACAEKVRSFFPDPRINVDQHFHTRRYRPDDRAQMFDGLAKAGLL